MSAVIESPQTSEMRQLSPLFQWGAILAGLAILYVPTYYRLARGLWTSEDNIHGPIVLAVVMWAVWEKRHALLVQSKATAPLLGWFLFFVGLLLYVVGRSQEINILEVGSQIPIFSGILLLFQGPDALRKLWFPLFFLIFMLPLPSFVVDTLTGPLKQNISAMVESLLYGFDYPIARSGVVLSIGPYQLLVADACSGLNSMISLTTMGLLYLYLMNHDSKIRTLLLLLFIWPIAFFANMLRVVALVLITYHFGDAAGQGFLHGFAGIVLFITGLLVLIAVDSIIGVYLPDKSQLRAAA